MIEGLVHLLFPHVCVSCRKLLVRAETCCCEVCLREFEPFPGTETGGNALSMVVAEHFGQAAVPFRAWCRYPFHHKGKLSETIHAMKYGGLFPIGTMFGKELGEMIAKGGGAGLFEAIVPMPLHRLKKIERTYNQAETIAGGIAQILGLPVLKGVIERNRYTGSQTGLSLAERRSNMADAFRSGRKRCPRTLLLVDDVLTTGSTMVAAASVLHGAGAESVSFAAVALTGKERGTG